MTELRIYSVSDAYINYLRSDAHLKNVFDNKQNCRTHNRKYLGIVFIKDIFNYFIPFSSPKTSDFQITVDGKRKIKKSIIPIIRMVSRNKLTGEMELKGTLKISNMIPVPESELTPYLIQYETDKNYQIIVQKEFDFIRANKRIILANARVLYNQKTKSHLLYSNDTRPKYLASTVDFLYAEQKCLQYIANKINI